MSEAERELLQLVAGIAYDILNGPYASTRTITEKRSELDRLMEQVAEEAPE